MNKYVFSLAVLILFATAGLAQNRAVLLHESFDGNTIPAGWSVQGEGANNWVVSTTNHTGGSPNEMQLLCSPTFNGMARLVTPAIDLAGVNSVTFRFNHYYDHFYATNDMGIATSSDGGATWNECWRHTYNSSSVYNIQESIESPDMGQPNVKFCVFVDTDSQQFLQWYFDDIEIIGNTALDLGLSRLAFPNTLAYGMTNLGVRVRNYGTETVTSVEMSYQVDDQAPVVETFAVNIPNMTDDVLTFGTPVDFDLGEHACVVKVLKVNGVEGDGNDENNELDETLTVVHAIGERKVMIESFSSATCGPCVATNQALHQLCEDYAGEFAFVKYPTFGDRYNTSESNTRFNYYGVEGVPYAFLDGESQGFNPVQASNFEPMMDQVAFFDVRSSFSMDGSTIKVVADIMPYMDANARVFVSVNEKMTVGNTGSNGETEFYHVMMKMLPNAEGTQTTFVYGEEQHFEFEYDMASTHVEEMNDLEVAVWIQDYATKEVFNSRFAYEYTDEHPYSVQNLKAEEEEGVYCHCLLVSWDAPSQGTPTGYNVYVNNVLVAEAITENEYEFTYQPEKLYVIEVQAIYGGDKTSLKQIVMFQETQSVDETENSGFVVYPNPSNGQFNLDLGEGRWDVEVYNLTGCEIYRGIHEGHSAINLGQCPKGMYFLKAKNQSPELTTKLMIQ